MLILDMNHVNRCSRWHNNCRLSLVFMPRGHFLLLAGLAGDRAPHRRNVAELHRGFHYSAPS
nr:unknown [Zea mays]